jgi:riboflavin biosynthesis pyrimidine reductase
VSSLEPFDVLYDEGRGRSLPLPRIVARVHGPLRLPRPAGRPYVIANFAETLDGVVALDPAGRSGAEEITGSEPHDRALMGLLRAAADTVIVGAGTLRSVPRHRWTAPHVYRPWTAEFAELRRRLRMPPYPLNVVVSGSGRLDLRLPVFSENEAPVLIVTTNLGARRLERAGLPSRVSRAVIGGPPPLDARAILRAVRRAGATGLVLLEGGPHLLGEFLDRGAVDELFLTVAPQIAGRGDRGVRPGLVAGRSFAPGRPLWGTLVAARRAASHLFLRFRLPVPRPPGRADRRPGSPP